MVLAVVPTAIQASLGLLPSTSVELRSPVAVGVPGVRLSTPPASTTVPMKSPLITAASFLPVMVMVTGCWVPSTVVAVNVSVSVCPTLSACTAGIAVVQRVDPEAGRCQGVGAVTVGARCRRADKRPVVVRIVEVGGVQIAGRSGRAGVTVVELARLHHRAGHRAGDVGGVVGAVDGDGHQLLGAADREGRKRIGQRLPVIACLHGGIVVVQRVGPDAGLRQRVGAELAPQRRVDGDPEVVGIVDVGGIEVAGIGRRARCAVIDAAGLDHRAGPAPVIAAVSLAPLMVMVTSCWVPSVVTAVKVSVSVSPALSACTAALLLSSV